jgi:hypothetical protein
MSDGLFENLNQYGTELDFLIGESAEDLKKQIQAIRSHIQIIEIYAMGTRHYCWFLSKQKINKKVKGK